ncbi:C-type lectin lectoxin-Enh6-like [Asterias amurensis]|uniref:C-type lectin lectoxin-Enh6-like n=1 Tax=Asterias amurensis TaxID=7602 RepID=UPI003AB565CC
MTAPGSAEEGAYLESLTVVNTWINCNDLTSQGTWECKDLDTYIGYRNWAEGNPDNYDGNERCVEIWRQSALWNDAGCYWDHPSVCKQSLTKIVHWR